MLCYNDQVTHQSLDFSRVQTLAMILYPVRLTKTLFEEYGKQMVNLKQLKIILEEFFDVVLSAFDVNLPDGLVLDHLEIVVRSKTKHKLSTILSNNFTIIAKETVLKFPAYKSTNQRLTLDVDCEGMEHLPN